MLIISSICFIATIIIYLTSKNFTHPMFVFYSIWTVMLFFYSINSLNFFLISELSLIIIILGLLFWGLGALSAYLINVRVISKKKLFRLVVNPIEKNFRYTVFFFITITILLLTSYQGFIAILNGSSIHDIRYILRDAIIGYNNYSSILYVYIAVPLSFLIIHYSTLRILYKKKIVKAFISIIIIVLLSILSEGGRFVLLYVAIDFLVVLQWKIYVSDNIGSDKIGSSYNKHLIRLGLILIFSMFVYITLTGGSQVLGTIYSYLSGPIPFMDLKIDEFLLTSSYSYGLTSLNGFLRPIFILLHDSGVIDSFPKLLNIAEYNLYIVEVPAYVSPSARFNGFATLFYDFFVDFGKIGVVVLSFLWGYLSNRIYLIYKKTRSSESLFLYLFILQALAISMLRFAFVSVMYSLSYFYMILIFLRFSGTSSKSI